MKQISKKYLHEDKLDIENKIDYIIKNREKIKQDLDLGEKEVSDLITYLQDKLDLM